MDQSKKICAVLAALMGMGLEIIETLHGRKEPGIIAHKPEVSKVHTDPEVQEIISFPRGQAVLTPPAPPAIPFIPSSYDPSIAVIRARKRQRNDYQARVMSYFSSQWTPVALSSSQSASS